MAGLEDGSSLDLLQDQHCQWAFFSCLSWDERGASSFSPQERFRRNRLPWIWLGKSKKIPLHRSGWENPGSASTSHCVSKDRGRMDWIILQHRLVMSDHDAYGKASGHVTELVAPLPHENKNILERNQSLGLESILMCNQITSMAGYLVIKTYCDIATVTSVDVCVYVKCIHYHHSPLSTMWRIILVHTLASCRIHVTLKYPSHLWIHLFFFFFSVVSWKLILERMV